jgi:hypothetical protein
MAFDCAGNLYADADDAHLYKYSPGGVPTLIAGFTNGNLNGLAFDCAGNLFASEGTSGNVYEFTNHAGTLNANPVTYTTGFGWPMVPAVWPPNGQAVKTCIAGCCFTGTNLLVNVANGVAGRTYQLLACTNLTLPLSQWTPVATNVLSASGNFPVTTNVVWPPTQQKFFILQGY